jgi:hypothetical protein
MAGEYIEPWLRGPLADVHPMVAPTLHAYAQAREDLAKWTDGLSDAAIWSPPQGLAPVGFHLRHIAASGSPLNNWTQSITKWTQGPDDRGCWTK